MEAWAAIFHHLRDSEDERLPLEGEEGLVEELGGVTKEDSLLRSFAMAMKTPGGRHDIGNPLTTPAKRLHLTNTDEEGSVPSPPDTGEQGLTALAYALAIVKGELGSKGPSCNYNTVHGGILAISEGLSAIEQAQLEVAEDQRRTREDQGRIVEALKTRREENLKLREEILRLRAELDQLQTASVEAWNKGNEAVRASALI